MSQSGQVGGMTVTDGVIPSTALTSGTTVKTINGSSIVGSGDLTVSAGDISHTLGASTLSAGTTRYIPRYAEITSAATFEIAADSDLEIG